MLLYNRLNMNIAKCQTLIILDWDDTLFPTTWVTSNRINLYTIRRRII